MEYKFSKHALERIRARGIVKDSVSLIIEHPESIVEQSDCTKVFQKLIEEENTKYLYRVFVNICKKPNLIITAYKTSKIDKYEH